MKQFRKEYSYIIVVITVSMYLNIENMISLMLPDIQKTFPSATTVEIQQVYSLIFLVELFMNFTVGFFVRKATKRKLLIFFQGMTVLGGLFVVLFGQTLGLLYMSSVIIGISAAIVSTLSRSIVIEYFPKEEHMRVFSIQQVSQSVGTIILQLITGMLIDRFSWRFSYLIFLFGLLSLLGAVFLMPEGEIERNELGEKAAKLWTPYLIKMFLVTGVYVVVFITFTQNIAFLVEEKRLGHAALAGLISAFFTTANFVAALFLVRITNILRKYTYVACFTVTITAFVIMALTHSVIALVIGACLLGLAQGTFTPSVYTGIGRKQNATKVTSSLAMINGVGSSAMYLCPYLVTIPASWFDDSVSTRFLWTAGICGLLTVWAIIECKGKENTLVDAL